MSSYTKKRIEMCFEAKGYRMLLSNIPNVVIFVKETEERTKAVVSYDICDSLSLEPQLYHRMLLDIHQKLTKNISGNREAKESHDNAGEQAGMSPENGVNTSFATKPVELLSLISAVQIDQAKTYLGDEFSTWILSEDILQLIIYENQIQNFDGLRELLERVFDPDFKCKPVWKKRNLKELSIVTLILIALNVLVYVIGTMTNQGELYRHMIRQGALSWQGAVREGQVYRFLSCMFLHGDMSHLLNNMLVLFVMGSNIEKRLGKLRFGILYFGAGILAGVFSVSYNIMQNTMVYSIGASGAIMGVVGAFGYILLRNRGKVEGMSIRQLAFFVLFSIYGGVTTSGVDNMAHIGGLISGFLLSILLYRKKRKKTSQVSEELGGN